MLRKNKQILDVDSIPPGMIEIHCCHCGRFFGFEEIDRGHVLLYCNKCKGWTTKIGSNNTEVDKPIE